VAELTRLNVQVGSAAAGPAVATVTAAVDTSVNPNATANALTRVPKPLNVT
jgi:hypothetical protein